MNNAGTAGEPSQDWARPVVHWALSAVDPDRMRAFYSEMFHWEIGDGPFMMIPSGIGSPMEGIGGHIQQGTAEHKGVSLYIQVRDIVESQRLAVELGGSALGEPFQFAGNPTMAVVNDPEGNSIMLVQQ
jgi:uncharacterized protein